VWHVICCVLHIMCCLIVFVLFCMSGVVHGVFCVVYEGGYVCMGMYGMYGM